MANFVSREKHIMGEDGRVRIYDFGECAMLGEKYIRLGEKSIDNNRRMVLINYGRRFLKRGHDGNGIVMERNTAGVVLTAAECTVWGTIERMVQLEVYGKSRNPIHPIHPAAIHGNIAKIAKLLLENPDDVNAPTIHVCIYNGYINIYIYVVIGLYIHIYRRLKHHYI